MYPLPITSDLNTLTTEYFSRHPSEWDPQSYLANILKRHPALEPAEVNSGFYTALRKIVASASSSSVAIARAQLLIDQVKQRLGRSSIKKQGFVNHGTVNIAPYCTTIKARRFEKGQHIITTGSRIPRGKISIEHTGKRRRFGPVPTRTPKRTLSQFYDEDEEGEYEDENEEVEDEDEDEDEEEEDREESSIPSDKHDGLNTCDTDASPITPPANTSTPPYSCRLDAFLDSFSAMPGADKRTFTCSERLLEDLIHAGVTANPATAGDALDWVIDLESDNVGRWFSTSELEELRSWLPPTPKVDQYFEYARHRYDKKSSIIALRETSESKPTPPDTPYDRRITFNATYVNVAVASLLSTIEQSATNESVGSPQSHREGWYMSKIWSILLDHCLDDLDNFTVSRTDIASKVGCPGRRFDAVFLAGGVGVDAAEVGAVELPGSGKRHGLRELMKAMVKALWKMSKCGDETGRKLQVVGVQHVGFHIRISTMCAVSRGVFVLQPGTWRAVPHKLENFETVFDVLQAVVVMKEIVRHTVEVLRAHAKVKTGGNFAL